MARGQIKTFKEEIIKKYFQISEVAASLSVTTATIRHYEKEFDVFPERRNSKGDRRYTVWEIGRLAIVATLMKHLHLTTAKRVFWRGQSEEILAILERGKATQSVEFDRMEGYPMMINP